MHWEQNLFLPPKSTFLRSWQPLIALTEELFILSHNLFEVNSLQHHFREQRTCRELIRELIWESLSFEEIITYISHRVLFVQV